MEVGHPSLDDSIARELRNLHNIHSSLLIQGNQEQTLPTMKMAEGNSQPKGDFFIIIYLFLIMILWLT